MHTNITEPTCCDLCFSPSQDVDGQAVPEICVDTDCECHDIQYRLSQQRPSLSDHILHTVVVFVCGAIFAAAILANADDVDALWGLLK